MNSGSVLAIVAMAAFRFRRVAGVELWEGIVSKRIVLFVRCFGLCGAFPKDKIMDIVWKHAQSVRVVRLTLNICLNNKHRSAGQKYKKYL
jgi:hypothetical protein